MPFHLGVDELCVSAIFIHVVMIFTDTNIVVAHRNPLGFVVACFDPKSFLLPRDAQKVAKK